MKCQEVNLAVAIGLPLPTVILFDLWRTLYLSMDKEPIRDVQEIFRHNLQVGDRGRLEAQVDPDFLRKCLTTNIRDPELFLQAIAEEFGYEVPEGGLERFRAVLQRETVGLARYNDVDETLEGLRRRGYRLGVISNLWVFPEAEIFAGKNERFGQLFEHRIYSFEIGHAKPAPEIFLAAAQRFDIEPSQCLVVGDHPLYDAKAAVDAGMRAVVIDRPGECKVQIPGVPVIRTLKELLPALAGPPAFKQ